MLGILRGHGAGIEILSEPGAGSTFRLCFPASTIAVDPQAPPDHAPAAAFTGQVLVVDDEPAILASARAMLESLGLRVATAGDGQQAMDHLARHGEDISLVLLDLTMPFMDGRQTLDALTRLRPDLPVILSSGYDPRQASPRVREFEGRTFLCKPYTLEQLQRALSAVPGLPGRDRVS